MYPELLEVAAALGLAVGDAAAAGTENGCSEVEADERHVVPVVIGGCAKVCSICLFAWNRNKQTEAIATNVRTAVQWRNRH